MGWGEGGCATTVKAAVSMKNPVCPRGVVSNQVGLLSVVPLCFKNTSHKKEEHSRPRRRDKKSSLVTPSL